MADARTRIACFIDGFNLYHALHSLGRPDLKWLDLSKLLHNFIDPARHEIVDIFYFSAYAEWLPGPCARHKEYAKALAVSGVIPIMGHFKVKTRRCARCGSQWEAHEEKETDVNIALWLINQAYLNRYDEAFLVSRDSDLAPAVRMVRGQFPGKRVKMIAPPNLRHSKELANAASPKGLASIKTIHLERSLFPEVVIDATTGAVVARRPMEYSPIERR